MRRLDLRVIRSGMLANTNHDGCRVANLKEADLRRFTVAGSVATQREILYNGAFGRIRTPRLGPDGSLYLTTDNGRTDRVIRLTP